jgi:N-acyl-L-homoserine lactone synthetase
MFAQTTARGRQGTTLEAGPFKVRFAVGGEPRLEEYRLRHRAFVDEHGWEAPGADGLERDAFDEFACSALLIDAESGAAAACQRLILPDWLPRGVATNVEREYRLKAGLPAVDFRRLRPEVWAEVSRLTIAPEFRSGSAGANKRAITTVTYASMALAIALEREVLFSVSDPRIAPLFRRMNLTMRQVGGEVDFHGRRAVFQIDVPDVFAGVPEEWKGLVDRLIVAARHATAGLVHGPGTSSHAA